MCDAPIFIKNLNYGIKNDDPNYSILHNTVDAFIPVPCGRCATCIHLKQIYLVQRVQMEAINHDLFYGTLTYNSQSLPIVSYGDIKFAYPDFSDWQKMIKMIRKDYPDLKFSYLMVSEYGGRKHRPHYHFILSVPRESDKLADKWSKAQDLFTIFLKYWRRNVAPKVWSKRGQRFIPNTRSPIWLPLCTYVRNRKGYNFDLHYLDPNSSKDGLDSVAFYVTKYVLKFDEWVDKFKSKLYFSLSDDDFSDAWDKLRPRCLMSKGFGSPNDPDVQAHIINGINFSLNDDNAYFPYYVSRHDGSTYPLSPYYRKKFVSSDSMLVFCSRRPDDEPDPFAVDDFKKKEFKMNLAKSFLRNQVSYLDVDDMSDINDFILDDYEITKPPILDSWSSSDWEDF